MRLAEVRAGRSEIGMRWTTEEGKTFEAVAQYMQVVQRTAFTAVAAGVVVHQHTRVLMANLHRCGDDMPVEDVRAGLSQLSTEMAAAYKAAGVGTEELRQVAAEERSGPQGKASVERRVAEANKKIAAALCDCAVCTEAAQGVRGQSRARATAVGEQQRTRKQKETQRKRERRKQKKKAELGGLENNQGMQAALENKQEMQAALEGHGDSQEMQAALESSQEMQATLEGNQEMQVGHGGSRLLQANFEDTLF